VSFPCWELFLNQTKDYQQSVLGENTVRLAVEAGSPQGWSQFVGDKGGVVGLDHFGASAPAEELFARFGFTVENVVKQAKLLLNS